MKNNKKKEEIDFIGGQENPLTEIEKKQLSTYFQKIKIENNPNKIGARKKLKKENI